MAAISRQRLGPTLAQPIDCISSYSSIVIIGSTVADVAHFAWPVVVLLLVGLLFWSKTGQALLGSIRHVTIGQVNLELDGANASEVKTRLEEVFKKNRREVERAFSSQSHVRQVTERRNAVASGVLKRVAKSEDFRCTVYVPDVLFDDALYCLLDYWPKGLAAGKAYSVRYGIIGRAWRLQTSQAESVVVSERPKLMREWAMTNQEAAGHTEDRSFLAILLARERTPYSPVGVLFADGPPKTFCEAQISEIESAAETRGLADAVSGVVREMRKRGPQLRVFER